MSSSPFLFDDPLWLRGFARHRLQRFNVPLTVTSAEYNAASRSGRLAMRRLWHDIEANRNAPSLTRRIIDFELKSAHWQGASPNQIRDLEILREEIERRGQDLQCPGGHIMAETPCPKCEKKGQQGTMRSQGTFTLSGGIAGSRGGMESTATNPGSGDGMRRVRLH